VRNSPAQHGSNRTASERGGETTHELIADLLTQRLELPLKVLSDLIERLVCSHVARIDPTFEPGAWLCLDDVWRVDGDVEADDEGGGVGFAARLQPPVGE
jgi:hypothetical protein